MSVLAALLAGCGEKIDKELLAELTVNKDFETIKNHYAVAVVSKNEKIIDHYEYALKSRAENYPDFDFELFQIATEKETQQQIEQLEKAMEKLNELSVRELKRELRSIKTVKNFMKSAGIENSDFINSIEQRIQAELDSRKK